MITHQSPSKNCRFIFPLLNDVDLLIDYNGLFWNAELSNLDSLSDFSAACTGFALNTFDSNGNTFVVITTKEFAIEERIEVMFESRLVNDFPCAFFDESNKAYDDFSIPIDAQGLSIGIDNNNHMIVQTIDYEEEDFSDEDDEFVDEYPTSIPHPDSEPDITLSVPVTKNENEEKVKNLEIRLNESISEGEELRSEIKKLESERDQLLFELKNNNSSTLEQGKDQASTAELERLKTLISQLVDKEYNDDYILTADSKINELTQKITDQKNIKKEKASSLELLEAEYAEVEKETKAITDNITHTMDLLHKAESIQRESDTELSVFQKRLNDSLNELQIDISTLEMYETQDGIESLLLEANDMKNKVESKLKALISTRQKDITNRFDNVTS